MIILDSLLPIIVDGPHAGEELPLRHALNVVMHDC